MKPIPYALGHVGGALRQPCADVRKRSTATGSVVPAGHEMLGVSFRGIRCIHQLKLADHIL